MNYPVVDASIDSVSSDRHSFLPEEFFEKVPVTQLLLQAAAVVERMQADVVLVVPREDLSHQETVGEVPAGSITSTRYRSRADVRCQ